MGPIGTRTEPPPSRTAGAHKQFPVPLSGVRCPDGSYGDADRTSDSGFAPDAPHPDTGVRRPDTQPLEQLTPLECIYETRARVNFFF